MLREVVEWVPKKDVISTKSKLNAVEGIDKVKSLKLLLLNWGWESQDWA